MSHRRFFRLVTLAIGSLLLLPAGVAQAAAVTAPVSIGQRSADVAAKLDPAAAPRFVAISDQRDADDGEARARQDWKSQMIRGCVRSGNKMNC